MPRGPDEISRIGQAKNRTIQEKPLEKSNISIDRHQLHSADGQAQSLRLTVMFSIYNGKRLFGTRGKVIFNWLF